MIKNKFSDDGVKEFNELIICGGTIKPVNAIPGKLRDEIKISPAKGGYRIDRNIKNVSEGTVLLKESAVNITGITFDKNPEKDYYYSVENPRLFKNFTLPVDTDRFSVPTNESAAVTERVCNSPYQPFPAVLLSNYESNRGVVFGSLSQDVFFHSYKFSHENGRVNVTVYSSFKGINEREIKAGEELSDVWYIGETRHAEEFTKVFEDYAQTLRGILLKKTGVKNANRYSLIWDSWNDGIYRDVNEKMLLEEAKAVKELFPAAEWFQLDDGYSKYCEKNVDLDAHGLGAAYEVDGIDEKKFPEGLKSYTDKIKALGLRPALWVGSLCPVKSQIYKEHPEWFFDYTHRLDFSAPLDVSKKEARNFMSRAINELIKENGFEGIKHDFWSYAFEDSKNVLAGKDKSGYEYREWWGKELRKTVPDDGYIESGCDLGMGNPFLREIFDNYRFGLDVGAGKWDNALTTMFWGAACVGTHTGDLFIPNCDSVGYLPGLNDTDFMFFVNFAKITASMAEISGRFADRKRNLARLKILQKATCCVNNGQNVYMPKFDYRRHGIICPEIMYLKSAHFSRDNENALIPVRTVGLFNTGEREKVLGFDFADLGLSESAYVIYDVWEERFFTVENSYETKLPPHGSALLSICEKDAVIFDCNICVNNVKKTENGVKFNIPYAAKTEMCLNGEAECVLVEGEAVRFKKQGSYISFTADKAGEAEIKFKNSGN